MRWAGAPAGRGEAQVCSQWRALHDEDLGTLSVRVKGLEMLPALLARFPTVRAASLARGWSSARVCVLG